jgi:hypothetical protein
LKKINPPNIIHIKKRMIAATATTDNDATITAAADAAANAANAANAAAAAYNSAAAAYAAAAQNFCCTKQQIKKVIQKVHQLNIPLFICNIIHLFLFIIFINVLYVTVKYEIIYLWLVILFGTFLKTNTIWVCTHIINTLLVIIGLNELVDFLNTVRCKKCYYI